MQMLDVPIHARGSRLVSSNGGGRVPQADISSPQYLTKNRARIFSHLLIMPLTFDKQNDTTKRNAQAAREILRY